MSEELKDILSHLNPEVDQETLLKYLNGQLSAREQHEVEASMLDTEFDMAALEGLEAFKNKQSLQDAVSALKNDLEKKVTHKHRKRKKDLSFQSWLIIAIVLVLLIAVVGYVLVKHAK